MKQIIIKSVTPIKIEKNILLSSINELREKYGEKKKDRSPISIDEILPKLNIFKNRDSNNGMLSFGLSYVDENQMPCTRDFPNFGMNVVSNSTLEDSDQNFLLIVDVKIKAGKSKWQSDEMAECIKIFSQGNSRLRLIVTLDETTDWSGHSAQVITISDTEDSLGIKAINQNNFLIEAS